jgi:hypothetical protein
MKMKSHYSIKNPNSTIIYLLKYNKDIVSYSHNTALWEFNYDILIHFKTIINIKKSVINYEFLFSSILF